MASVCRFSSHVIYSNLFSIFSHFFIYIASSVLVFLYFASSFVLLLSSLFSLFSPFWLILSSALYLFFFFSSLLCPVWHPYFTVVFSSNLLALKWSYQLSRIFYWPYLFFPLYCVCLCAFCVHSCVSLWRRKKRCCRIRLFLLCITFSSSWSFFFLFLLFFPACSPPLHQGRSSPGAEIQFRSSSSAFCALTCSQWVCAILSPPSSDWATRSRFFPLFPCCFIRMLQLCIKYTGGQAPHSKLKIIKVVYSHDGKSKLAPPMRYIHSAPAKWSLRSQHSRQMITFVTPSALLLFIDTVWREEIRTCEAKKSSVCYWEEKVYVLSNVFMICHSKLQVRRILLMLVFLPIKTLLGVVFSDQSGVCHISGLIIGQNDWLCIRSYLTTLQITTSLLRYTELSILALKGTEKVVTFCLNEAKSISADQCSVIFICCFFFMKDKIFIVYLIF